MIVHEYKYGATDWRRDAGETFQKTSSHTVDYTVVGGSITKTVETTLEYADPLAGVPPAGFPDGPPYEFADHTYRRDVAFSWMVTSVVTTTYSQVAPDSYQVTTDTFDVLTGITTTKTVTVNGLLPTAPSKGSPLSSLTQQPLVSTLTDKCSFVDSRVGETIPWAEGFDDLCSVSRRRNQRATAIVRKIKMRANPKIAIGQTARVICAQRKVDGNHMVVGREFTFDQDGTADMLLWLEYWTR